MPDIRESLRSLTEALPAGTAVPVPREWLLELLDGGTKLPEPTDIPAADLTVEEVAQRFNRHTSTVRGWIAQGRFAGAYRLRGREWRIPATGLAAFEEAERGAEVAAPASKTQADISDWRRVR